MLMCVYPPPPPQERKKSSTKFDQGMWCSPVDSAIVVLFNFIVVTACYIISCKELRRGDVFQNVKTFLPESKQYSLGTS